jgi:hypothetical protein
MECAGNGRSRFNPPAAGEQCQYGAVSTASRSSRARFGKAFGVTVGGLFLALPSIAVASLTLVERDKGKNAVGADAAGTSLGSIGLLAFGAVVWLLAPSLPAWLVLGIAVLTWFALSSGLWLCWWWARHR